jgi:hypothetical protein
MNALAPMFVISSVDSRFTAPGGSKEEARQFAAVRKSEARIRKIEKKHPSAGFLLYRPTPNGRGTYRQEEILKES